MPPLTKLHDKGDIHLHKDFAGTQVVVSIRCRLARKLESAGGELWGLEFDGDGDGFVFTDSDPPAMRSVEEVLGGSPFASASGCVYFVPEGSSGKPTLLDAALNAHVLGGAGVECGTLRAEVSLAFARFGRMVDGGHYVWSLPSLFSALKMGDNRGSTGTPSRWISHGWASWVSKLGSVGLHMSLIKGKPLQGESSEPRRILPFPSVSTGGLLFLVTMWAFRRRIDGGFVGQRQADMAELALALVSVACSSDFEIPVFFDLHVQRTWPGPTSGKSPHVIRVVGGRIDIGGLLAACDNRLWEVKQSVARLANKEHITFADFAQHLARETSAAILWKQVVWGLADRLEGLLDRRGQGGVAAGLPVELGIWGSCAGYSLTRRLSHYLMCCKDASQKLQYASISTDKSRVHALGLRTSVVVLPTNQAFWPPPQVAIGGGWGRGEGGSRPPKTRILVLLIGRHFSGPRHRPVSPRRPPEGNIEGCPAFWRPLSEGRTPGEPH